MKFQPPGQTSGESDPFDVNLPEIDDLSTAPHGASFGDSLHGAREARGLNVETCAHTLKLPARVLRQLERDHSDGIDSKVYLASYIVKYARYLGIDEASIAQELDRIKQVEAPLVATGGISHSRFLLDRYATAATYVVLTAVIVVPMIWLGVRGTLDRSLTHLSPLDAAPVAQLETTTSETTRVDGKTGEVTALASVLPLSVQNQNQPLLASMAPFPSLENSGLPPVQPTMQPMETGTGGHSLTLSLSSASWVEVTHADGARVEYGLLPAGSSRTYHSNQALDVRIGNASGAQVVIDGAAVGLDEFRHANVAHFRMQMQDGKASAASL